jgi:hypothetical protein
MTPLATERLPSGPRRHVRRYRTDKPPRRALIGARVAAA